MTDADVTRLADDLINGLGVERSFVDEVGRVGGAAALMGFAKLFEMVARDPRLEWELGTQPKDLAYLCSLATDPETVLLRANNFGSISFWLWRNAASAERQDQDAREDFLRLLGEIPVTKDQLNPSEKGFKLDYASIAEQINFDRFVTAMQYLLPRVR